MATYEEILNQQREQRAQTMLLVPNSSIQRALARRLTNLSKQMTKGFINRAGKEDFNIFEAEKEFRDILEAEADGIVSDYQESQRRYSNTVLTKAIEGMYQNPQRKPIEFTENEEENKSNNILLILGLSDIFFQRMKRVANPDGSINLSDENVMKAVELADGLLSDRSKTIADKMNFEDFLQRTTESLVKNGITRAIWTARDFGQHKRFSHHNILNGQEYDLREGLYDTDYGDYIQCGELNGCRCVPKIIL